MARTFKVPYDKLKQRVKELARNGQLLNGIRLDSASVVLNGKKFTDSHMALLEGMRRRRDAGHKVPVHMIAPAYDRLLKYVEEVEKNIK
jgi:hypothetical protein